ncbi:hypothetical protein JTE90_023617, partial [Oedothorax gibbosus]
IKPCRPKQSRVLYDITTYCEVCKKANNAGTLLLCDCCDLGYHCKCLQPPLQEVPAGVWYCPVCVTVETKIKKSKDPKEVQKENAAQSNQENLPSENGQDTFSPQPQTKHFKGELTASIPEKSSENRTVSASLRKSNPRNYTNDEAIRRTDKFLVNKTEVDKNLNINNLSAATLNLREPLTTQISIKSKVKNNHPGNISTWSRRLRNKDPRSNETVTVQCDSTQKHASNQTTRADNFLVSETEVDKNVKISNLKAETSNVKDPSIVPSTVQNKHQENNSIWSRRLRKKDTESKPNETVTYCSVTGLSGRKQEEHDKNEIEATVSLVKYEQVNVCPLAKIPDFKNNSMERECINNSKTENKSSSSIKLRNKGSRLDTNKGKIPSCPSEERIKNNSVFEVKETLKNLIHSDNLCNSPKQSISHEGFKLHKPGPSNSNTVLPIQKNSYKCCKNATKSSKYGSEFSKNQLQSTKRSVKNIHNENKDAICVLSSTPEIKKKKTLRNFKTQIKDSEGTMNLNTDIINTPNSCTSTHGNVTKDVPKLGTKEEQPVNKFHVQPTEEGLNKKNRNTCIELRGREVNNAKIETNFENTKWCLHYCQKPDDFSVLCLKKGNNLKSEKLGNKEHFSTFQTNVRRNKSTIPSTAEEFQKNVIVTSQNKISIENKKEYCRNVQSTLLDIQNGIPFADSKISINETDSKFSEESNRRDAFLSLYNSKSSLSNESENFLKLNTNSCLSGDETGILIHPESSESTKYYFLTKKSISNFAMEKLSLLASEKKQEQNMNKMGHKWNNIEEQNSAISSKEVFEKNIQSTTSSITFRKYKEPSNNKFFEKSIQSSGVTALSATSEKYEEPSSTKRSGLGRYDMKKQDSALCNSDIPEVNIHSTKFTTLSDASEERSKDKTGQSLCYKEKEYPAIHNSISEKRHSSISIVSSSTSKTHKESSKNKLGRGWYHYEDENPAISNSTISEKIIQSKRVPEDNEAGSQKPTKSSSSTKVKTHALKNALYTMDNISGSRSFNQDSITPPPKFSVFESVDNTCASRQKYFSINKSVMDTSLSSKTTLSAFAYTYGNPLKGDQSDINPFHVQTASLATNKPKSYHSREVHYAIKAKMNLADELLKIEREKWPRHLKKYKRRRSSCSKYPGEKCAYVCGSEIKKK